MHILSDRRCHCLDGLLWSIFACLFVCFLLFSKQMQFYRKRVQIQPRHKNLKMNCASSIHLKTFLSYMYVKVNVVICNLTTFLENSFFLMANFNKVVKTHITWCDHVPKEPLFMNALCYNIKISCKQFIFFHHTFHVTRLPTRYCNDCT